MLYSLRRRRPGSNLTCVSHPSLRAEFRSFCDCVNVVVVVVVVVVAVRASLIVAVVALI